MDMLIENAGTLLAFLIVAAFLKLAIGERSRSLYRPYRRS